MDGFFNNYSPSLFELLSRGFMLKHFENLCIAKLLPARRWALELSCANQGLGKLAT